MIQNTTRYTKTAVVLHWLIAIFVVVMFAIGWFMADIPKEGPKQSAYDLLDLGIYTWQLSEEVTARTFYFNLHKSLGITIFALIAIRILWRVTHKPPALLTSYKAVERKVATGTHHLLYLMMVAVPATGLLTGITSKYGLKWFGITIIEGLANKPIHEASATAHEVLTFIFLALIVLHIAGALKHKFVDKDGTMKRMSIFK
ncbi:MAG: cytochrome b [Methylotenera sp.]|nr:cytochrome b [Methylotenera sp.]